MGKIAWSVAHQEFIISDHYYFWKLEKFIKEDLGKEVEEVADLEKVLNGEYDVLIFNYPEIPFVENDIEIVEKFLKLGGKVGIFGYYKNEDRIADTINSLISYFGMKHNGDIVTDTVNNEEGDSLMVKAKFVKGGEVVLACTATVSGGEPIVVGYETSKSSEMNPLIYFSEKRIHNGILIVGGTCVFWDNYSINRGDNKSLIRYILE